MSVCINSSCIRNRTKYTLYLGLTSLSTTRCILLEIVFPVLLSFDLVTSLTCQTHSGPPLLSGCYSENVANISITQTGNDYFIAKLLLRKKITLFISSHFKQSHEEENDQAFNYTSININ